MKAVTGSRSRTTVCSFSLGPTARRVEANGSQCFRGNISRPNQTYSGFDETLRLYLLNREAKLKITAETGRCQWRGETMDYSQAIEAMQVLEHKAAVDMAVT